MRRTFLIFLLTVGILPLLAQERLDAILDQIPATNQRTLSRLMVDLANQGATGVLTLSQSLKNDGDDRDLKQRYALSGLAKYLGQEDTDSEAAIEKAFVEEINRHQAPEIKVFLLEQLQFFASERSLPQLRNLVRSLCDPAVGVITQIGGKAAMQTMIESYEEAGDYCKQTLAKSIAGFEDRAATDMLEKIASSPQVVPKAHIMPLLAKRGAPSSQRILQAFANSNPELGNSLLLDHASVQAKKGNPGALVTLASSLLKGDVQPSLLQKAIQMLAQFGGSSGRKLLLKTFKKGDPAHTSKIVSSLDTPSPLPLSMLFKRINKVDGATQIALLQQAVNEGYTAAIPAAKALVKDSDPSVKKAAIQAVSSLGKRNSLPDLQQMMVSTNEEIVCQEAASQMSRWIDSTNVDMLSGLLTQTSGVAKASLIHLLADRGLQRFFPQVKAALESSEQVVRQSAFAALPKLAKDQELAQLVTIAPLVSTDVERQALVQGLTNNVRSGADPVEKTQELTRLIGGDPQIIQSVLPKIGGKPALSIVNDKFANQPEVYQKILQEWETPEVLGLLVARAREKSPSEKELGTILHLSRHPQLPPDQKLLHLRELMPLVSSLTEQKKVMSSMGNIRTQSAFDYIARFLDHADLRETAAATLVSVALPPAGRQYGLVGAEVRSQLMRADTILTGTDQDYTLAFLHNYLHNLPSEEGYVKLFNGLDLTGWKGLVGNPISRDTMFGLERQTQERAVAKSLAERWQVEDGILTYRGDGFDNLCTIKKYRDFELVLDWRIDKDADSGIYLRGSPQVQIWDPQGSEEQNRVGSGGLFNNQVHESKPLVTADNPAGEWNTFRIKMIDDKVTVWLNGVLVTDRVVLENYWNRELPIFREEQIELQAHTTVVQFRDIYIRELHGAPELTSMELRQGFKPLFNGINLDGWVGNKTDYVVENGEIVIYPGAGGRGNLFTEQEYENFRLRFDFKLTPGANNGLGIHAPLEGDAAYLGKELQILDNTAEKYANLKEYQYHGSVYGVVAARRGELKPVGEWNTQEVVMKNNRVSVVLNNQRILSADLNIVARNGTLDGRDHPGLERTKGHIGFLGHGDEVHFRNIRILEISDDQ